MYKDCTQFYQLQRRRKIEMSVSEVQFAVLERRNAKLRRICNDFTKKISLMKDVLEHLDCRITTPSSLLLADSSNVSSDFKVLTRTLSEVPTNKLLVA